MTIHELLVLERKERGYSQKDLAYILKCRWGIKINSHSLSLVEKGHKPPQEDLLVSLAQLYQLEPDFFLTHLHENMEQDSEIAGNDES